MALASVVIGASPVIAQDDLAPTRGDLWSQAQTIGVGPWSVDCIAACVPVAHAALGFGVDLGARFVASKLFGVENGNLPEIGLAASIGWGLGREAPSFFNAENVGVEGQDGYVSAASQRLDALLDLGEHIAPAVLRYVHERYGTLPAFIVGGLFVGADYYLVTSRDLR